MSAHRRTIRVGSGLPIRPRCPCVDCRRRLVGRTQRCDSIRLRNGKRRGPESRNPRRFVSYRSERTPHSIWRGPGFCPKHSPGCPPCRDHPCPHKCRCGSISERSATPPPGGSLVVASSSAASYLLRSAELAHCPPLRWFQRSRRWVPLSVGMRCLVPNRSRHPLPLRKKLGLMVVCRSVHELYLL
jgi:hypothetical protein